MLGAHATLTGDGIACVSEQKTVLHGVVADAMRNVVEMEEVDVVVTPRKFEEGKLSFRCEKVLGSSASSNNMNETTERLCASLCDRLFPEFDDMLERCEWTEGGIINVFLHPSLVELDGDENVDGVESDEKCFDLTGHVCATDGPLVHPLMRAVNIESYDPQRSLASFLTALDGREYQDRHCACRSRGYDTFEFADGKWKVRPSSAFKQTAEHNELAAQKVIPEQRKFAPLPHGFVESAAMSEVMKQTMDGLAQFSGKLVPLTFVELGIHLIKIRADGEGGVGTPVPEGRHQDGFDYVSITVLDRRGIDGGVNLFAESKTGAPFFSAIVQPGHGFVIDDRRLWHDVSPIRATGGGGSRCVVVVTVTIREQPHMDIAGAA